jgi:hypothetical protein
MTDATRLCAYINLGKYHIRDSQTRERRLQVRFSFIENFDYKLKAALQPF